MSTGHASSEGQSLQTDRPRILVGVDGSEDGLRAVRYGTRAALAMDGTLHLVHAVDDAVLAGAWGVVYDPRALEEAGAQANDAAAEAAAELGLAPERVDSEVVLGNAAAVLSRMSEQSALLVVGRRSVSGLERMFIGSTSVALADASHCPLVVVSQAATPQPTGGLHRIAVAIDAQTHSPTTLGWAFREAEQRDASLEVVHVAPHASGGDDHQVREAARQGIEEILAPLRRAHPGVEAQVVVSQGSPVDVLVDLSSQVDLLVLGVQKPKLLGIHLGGVMRAVLAHAQAPVVLVR